MVSSNVSSDRRTVHRHGGHGRLHPACPLKTAPKRGGVRCRQIATEPERGIGKRTHCNGNCIGSALRLPKYRGAAIGAKVKVHREAAVGGPSISAKGPIRCNVITGKECGYAVRAACSLLAIQAMTQRNLGGIALTRDAELPASAGRDSRRHDPSPHGFGVRALASAASVKAIERRGHPEPPDDRFR